MSSSKSLGPSGNQRLAGALVIACASLWIYYPALHGDFIIDDEMYVTDNWIIRSPDGLYRLWFTTQATDYYPVTNTSFWLEWRLWGMNPTGYHVTNLALHVATALLVWATLQKLAIPGAFLAALLFAVHPMNVESVAWISQRKDLLAVLFFLLSILWYVKYRERSPNFSVTEKQQTDPPPKRRSPRNYYWLSFVAFVLAMLSKGSIAVLPAILLLITWWKWGRLGKQDLLRTAPFFVVAVLLTLVNIWCQSRSLGEQLHSAPLIEKTLGAGAVVWFYLAKAIAPLNLIFVYPQWQIRAEAVLWWLPALVSASVTMFLLWHCRGRWSQHFFFAWAFFCLALLPVMGFANVGFMKYSLVADHYIHVAVIAVVALAAVALTALYQRAPRFALIPSVTIVGALMFAAHAQSSLYVGPLRLYEETLAKNPDCWLMHNNIATLLVIQHKYDEATDHLHTAIEQNPSYDDALYNYGCVLVDTGHSQEAIEIFEKAIRINPYSGHSYLALASQLAKLGRHKEAVDYYEKGLQFVPRNYAGQSNLGNELMQQGLLFDAVVHLADAVDLKPGSAEAHNNLAVGLASLGRYDEAQDEYQAAIAIDPNYIEPYFNLAATCYEPQREMTEALRAAQKALALAKAQNRPDQINRIQQWLSARQ